ncbi:nuclear export mediator factor NEMF homolog isoform X2 [Agrilus planipennis]|uniref:Nuclear export mediator factor NEMF homolog isoform X2 n=1 Tax=Agrilus planipennis TaxID=224129 RepID=A0A7F5RDN4_AGRPL|nr:nuclear export mediator factor NEMF homolog isoform X2 [Agrilus planipennis]
MKTRFNSYDIVCVVAELQKIIGMRVNNIYDVDNKTYLIKLHKGDEKRLLLLESGIRIHITNFEWPKNNSPSGFSMKLRKHLKNKRIELVQQMERDRIIILKFGSGEAAYSVILELFDRGNIILADYEMTIVSVLRPHIEEDKVKFVAHEKYPERRVKDNTFDADVLKHNLENKNNQSLKKALLPMLDYGLPLIEHVLIKYKLEDTKIGKNFDISNNTHIENLMLALQEAEEIVTQAKNKQHSKGYIIVSKERSILKDSADEDSFCTYIEFHPMLFRQHSSMSYRDFDSFNSAVDEFYSKMESQKIELQTFKQEQEAWKKLEKIRVGYSNKVDFLEKEQMVDKQKAELITRNRKLVDDAILVVRAALANQISWDEIQSSINSAAVRGDVVAKHIKGLKLEINHISLYLEDPYSLSDSIDTTNVSSESTDIIPNMVVDVDLGLSAFSNATKYYDKKRTASKKQQKTVESQAKVIKSAEKKNRETIKKVQMVNNIQKIRKAFWFEKFFWFISSENFLVIGGRDQQQNELIVKRYLKPKDVYVHADIHGASSIVVKNPSGQVISPKTLIEAGTAAICYSVAWDAKVVPNAYWVWGEQVSKTAPTGEYLSTGSFMVRGKKNFLPPLNFILGFGILFRVEENCIEKHKGERKPITSEADLTEINTNATLEEIVQEENNFDKSDGEEVQKNINSVVQETESDNMLNVLESNSTLQNEFPLEMSNQILGSSTDQITNIDKQGTDKITLTTEDEVSKSLADGNYLNKTNCSGTPVVKEKDNKKNAIKRGHRGKMKKISEKYKDQDEEERMLRMDILKSAGNIKETKKSKKDKLLKNVLKQSSPHKSLPSNIPKEKNVRVFDEDFTVQDNVDAINTLTGKPFLDDELLFAVPVVAPYNSLNGYKFKIKITPGNTKRGKALKTAISMFLNDKLISNHEKNLLHVVKEEQIIQNFPGKLKLSSPGLSTNKK